MHSFLNSLARVATPWIVAVGAFTAPTQAATDFPQQQPLRLIVAFAPGTGSDALSRLLGEGMGKTLGQSVIVENRPGGGGILGTDYVARSTPDGYTLAMGTTSTLITNPHLNPNAQYTVEKNFQPVTGLARSTFVIVTANNDAAPANIKELIERLQTGNADYASSGMGTIVHLTGERFVRQVGAKATHVPYKGAAQSLADVAGGVTVFTAETLAAALPLIRAGKLRALAVTSDERNPALPDTPTVIESGYPNFSTYSWFALMAPAGTPADVVKKLDIAAQQAMSTPEMQKRLEALAFQPMLMGPNEITQFIKKESPFWTDFLDQAQIRLE